MLFIFSTQMLIRHLWLLKTAVFLHWCLIHYVLLGLHLIHFFPGDFASQGVLNGATAIDITTLSVTDLIATLSINDTNPNDTCTINIL